MGILQRVKTCWIAAICVTALLGLVVLNGCESDEMRSAKESYTSEMQRIESQVDELEAEIAKAETLAATEEVPLDADTRVALEDAISTAKAEKDIELPEMPSRIEGINAAISELKEVDLAGCLDALSSKEAAMSESIEKMKLVTNPAESFVLERLQGVDGIAEMAAVTEDNDPNGKLGKAGGYTSAVFFASPMVDQAAVSGEGVIGKGTDGGGCVEVYGTVEDAENRNAYLAAFDGGFLSSGSHEVVGTVVVRTSDKLAASQQKGLEANIIAALTALS